MSALRSLASAAAATLHDTICAVTTPEELDQLARLLWRGYGEGAICDDDAQYLQHLIDRRRPRRPQGHHNPLGGTVRRVFGRFAPRQRPRSPDRKASRDRRRRLGGSSALPDTLRHHYTEGQRAVLCILAGEIKHHGICDLPIDKIAALAGVCRTTVQTTLHEARRLGHISITERPRPGRKNLTNVIGILSREWLTWIRRGPTAHRPIGSNSLNLVSTTKTTDKQKEGTFDEKSMRRSHGPPQAPMLRRA